MAKKRRKNKNYDISGVIEVINITKGRRTTTYLNFDKENPIKNIEISSSIVIKTPNYEEDATENTQEQEISPQRSSDER